MSEIEREKVRIQRKEIYIAKNVLFSDILLQKMRTVKIFKITPHISFPYAKRFRVRYG